MTPLRQSQSSFVIRIWWEQADDASADHSVWRGWVQHIRSGETVHVQDLEGLLDFIERWTGKLATPDEPPARLK